MFGTLAILSDILKHKAGLGLRAKAAYDSRNKSALKDVARTCLNTARLVELFKTAVQEQWFQENKSFGYEVLDIRLGGLKERLISCAKRLTNFAEDQIPCIEELEEERLPVQMDKDGHPSSSVGDNIWREMVTASVM